MRALHFGAGNIGRGFIGKVLSQAGFEVVFADVVQNLITELAQRKKYPVRIVGELGEKIEIVTVKGAVFSNTDDILTEIIQADILTTAVGLRILERIAPTIKKGLELRKLENNTRPLNIIACENSIKASSALKELVLKDANDDLLAWVAGHVGFVDCAVDRIVPPARHSDPLEVTVEDFCEWIVDSTQLVGELPPIPDIVHTEHLMAFVERKLMTVNTGHAICAYLGKLYGHQLISQSIRDPRVRPVVEGAMRESGAVLVKRYKMDPEAHEKYIQKIIKRYENIHIVDDVTRVGREPIRKLSPEDRLIKPLRGCIELGLPFTNLIKGVAAALLYNDPDDVQATLIQKKVSDIGWEGTLREISGLNVELGAKVVPEIQSVVNEFGNISRSNITQV